MRSNNEQTNGKSDIFSSEKTFHLIKEIESNPQTTQRDLAKKLTVSLGKINFLINALVEKGIIKVQNFKNAENKLAYTYLMTPYGVSAKLRLAKEFFEWKTKEYERLKKEIEIYKKEIDKNSQKKPF